MSTDGPYADDLAVGQALPTAPSITLDQGLAATYQAITGDGLRLPLSDPDSRRVSGSPRRLVNPALVIQVAIGQSTVATRLVIANLFYRDVALLQQVHTGDTLTTTVTPIARQLTRPNPSGRRAKVTLRVETVNQNADVVCRFERVALLPCRDAESTVEVGDVGTATPDRPLEDYLAVVPSEWRVEEFPAAGLPSSPTWSDPLADTVSSALELVRLTQNLAAAHRDVRRGQSGRRLVYGGHAVGLAQASLSRACPGLVTVLGWRACDHPAPVFEGDVLDFEVRTIDRLDLGQGVAVVGFRVLVTARHTTSNLDEDTTSRAGTTVLDWTPVALVRCHHTIEGRLP